MKEKNQNKIDFDLYYDLCLRIDTPAHTTTLKTRPKPNEREKMPTFLVYFDCTVDFILFHLCL